MTFLDKIFKLKDDHASKDLPRLNERSEEILKKEEVKKSPFCAKRILPGR